MVHRSLADLRLYAARRDDGFLGLEPPDRSFPPECDGTTERFPALLGSSKLDGGLPQLDPSLRHPLLPGPKRRPTLQVDHSRRPHDYYSPAYLQQNFHILSV